MARLTFLTETFGTGTLIQWHSDLSLAALYLVLALHHIVRVGYYTSLRLQRWLWIAYVAVWGVLVVSTRTSAELEGAAG